MLLSYLNANPTRCASRVDEPAAIRRQLGDALPASWQGLITRISCKALPGQELPRRTRTGLLLSDLCVLLVGLSIAIGAPALGSFSWVAYVFGGALFLHASRTLQVQHTHQASHGTLVGNGKKMRWINDWIGAALSIVLVLPDYAKYKRRHLHAHHRKDTLSTQDDPEVLRQVAVGLLPGLPKRVLYRRLLWSFFNPAALLRRVFFDRIGSHLRSASVAHRFVFVAYVVAVGLLITFTGRWDMLIFLAVTLFWLYENVAFLRILVEHRWPAPGPTRDAVHVGALTPGIVCASPPPPAGLGLIPSVLGWTKFSVQWIGHLFVRAFVLVGVTTPCHDYHHINPQADDWANSIAARDRDRRRRRARGDDPYVEVCGFRNAIDLQFTHLSNSRAS